MIKIENLALEDIKQTIVYAPNSAGKTRLSERLASENKNVLLFTSNSIDNLLAISGRNIVFGKEAKIITQNEQIKKEINASKGNEYIKSSYNVKTARELVSNSFLFSSFQLKKIDTFELYKSIHNFLKHKAPHLHIKAQYDKKAALFLDENLKFEDYQKILSIFGEKIEDKNTCVNGIRKTSFDLLYEIYNKLSYGNICPLCGYDWGSNQELKKQIENKLHSYNLSNDDFGEEDIVKVNRVFEDFNNIIKTHYFVTNEPGDLNITAIINNFELAIDYLALLAADLYSNGSNLDSKPLLDRFEENEIEITNEQNARNSNQEFEKNVIEKVKELIVLPENFDFTSDENSISIVSDKKAKVDPRKFLSESEKRRLSVAILFAEFDSRVGNYLILDDPADSNDDYYFDGFVNMILDYIKDNSLKNWTILTHETRIPLLFAKFSDINEGKLDCRFKFYLPKASDRGNKKPPLFCYDVTHDDVIAMNEHETILFKNIFSLSNHHKVDPELALLSSFNQCRGLYFEILKNHKISKSTKDRLRKKIELAEQSYEHFDFSCPNKVKMSDLSIMNKAVYTGGIFKTIFNITSHASAIIKRKKLLKKDIDSISSDNPLIRHILYTILRVLNCHYEFEKKLALWGRNNLASFNESGFEDKHGIGRKIGYVEGLVLSSGSSLSDDFLEFKKLFLKCRNTLNEFSHSATLMFPPFLSVNPLDLTKLEKKIVSLP